MFIEKLVIKGLFGYKDFKLEFSDRVNILTGRNGSGKTIILDILNCVTTGDLTRLLQYDFKRISLFARNKKAHRVDILRKARTVELAYGKAKETATLDALNYGDVSSKFEKLKNRISDAFDTFFIPISRNTRVDADDSNGPQHMRKKRHGTVMYRDVHTGRHITQIRSRRDGIDGSLNCAKELFMKEQRQISAKISVITEELKKNLINESFSPAVGAKLEVIEEGPKKKTKKGKSAGPDGVIPLEIFTKARDLIKNKKSILSNFKKTGIVDASTIKKLNNNFKSIEMNVKKIEGLQRKHPTMKSMESFEAKDFTPILTLILNEGEITRLSRVYKIINNCEKEKKAVQEPVETFLNIINKFFKETRKKLLLDDSGDIKFENADSPDLVNILRLSSGEKQLFIFFAYLIYQIRKTPGTIYLIDEPEISLHLGWQRLFLDSILESSENTQIIVATHAPGIIASYGDCAHGLDG